MITIVAVGEIDNNLLIFLQKRLQNIFKEEFVRAPPLSIPFDAYNEAKDQYNGTQVINYILNNINSDKYDKILGIIGEDLYADKLNFIFGQAQSLNGKVCLISLKRLYQEFYNLPENEYLLRLRTLKEVVHELGHLWGLGHCAQNTCVMRFSNNILEVDAKELQFCSSCNKRLENLKGDS